MLSDAIEQKLEDVIDRVPGGSEVARLSNRRCKSHSLPRLSASSKAVTQAFALNLTADGSPNAPPSDGEIV